MSQRTQVSSVLVWFRQCQIEIEDLDVYRDCNLFVFSNVKNQRVFNHALVLCYILRRMMRMMTTTMMIMMLIFILIMMMMMFTLMVSATR